MTSEDGGGGLKAELAKHCGGVRRVDEYPLGEDLPTVWVRSITAAERLAIERVEKASPTIVAIMLTVCNEAGQLIYTASYKPATRSISYSPAEYAQIEAMDGRLFDALKAAVNGHCCFLVSFDELRDRAKKNSEAAEDHCD